MTDGAGLPIALSDLVADAPRAAGSLDATDHVRARVRRRLRGGLGVLRARGGAPRRARRRRGRRRWDPASSAPTPGSGSAASRSVRSSTPPHALGGVADRVPARVVRRRARPPRRASRTTAPPRCASRPASRVLVAVPAARRREQAVRLRDRPRGRGHRPAPRPRRRRRPRRARALRPARPRRSRRWAGPRPPIPRCSRPRPRRGRSRPTARHRAPMADRARTAGEPDRHAARHPPPAHPRRARPSGSSRATRRTRPPGAGSSSATRRRCASWACPITGRDGRRVRRRAGLPDPPRRLLPARALAHRAPSSRRCTSRSPRCASEGDAGREGLAKLGGLAGEGADTALAELDVSPGLAVLFDAVSRRATVTFSYRGERAPPRSLRRRAPLRSLVRRRPRPRPGRPARVPGRPPRRRARARDPTAASRRPTASIPPSYVRADPLTYGEDQPVDAHVLVDAAPRRLGGRPARRRGGGRAPARRRGRRRAPGREPRRVPVVGASTCSTTPRSCRRPSCAPTWSRGSTRSRASGRSGREPAPARRSREPSQRASSRSVPWILAHPGVTIAELAARFEVSERELERDLELLPMCGLPPYTAGPAASTCR